MSGLNAMVVPMLLYGWIQCHYKGGSNATIGVDPMLLYGWIQCHYRGGSNATIGVVPMLL